MEASAPAEKKQLVNHKKKRDLSARLAFTKPELQRLLPFGHTTLEAAIKKGDFPDGVAPWPGAHKIWTLAQIQAWIAELEEISLQQAAQEGLAAIAREGLS